MSLQVNVDEQLKAAMRAKDKVALESLRAIKSDNDDPNPSRSKRTYF